MKRALAFLLLAAAPGCSALGLDQFPQDTCAVDSDCDGLEVEQPPADDCHTWQCNRETMHCEIDVLDGDEDGAPAMLSPSMAVCAMDATVDCDDATSTTFPMAPELCNGRDDDCDGRLDDGVAATLSETPLMTMGDTRTGVVGRGAGGDDADLLALFQVDTGAANDATVLVRRAGAELTETVLPTFALRGATRTPIQLGRGPEAIVQVGSRLLVLFAAAGACNRLALAASDAGLTELVVPGALADDGLPTEDPPPTCNAATRGELAVDPGAGSRALVVYANPGEECDTTGPSPVVASVATLGGATVALEPGAPIAIGTTTDWLAPAVVAIAPSTFLVAFPTDSAIEIHRVDATARTSVRVHQEAVSGASGIALARDADQLVLGWAEGCGATPAHARVLTVVGGGASVTPGVAITLAGEAHALSITRQPALEEWGLLLQDPGGWSLERFDDTGAAIGPPTSVRALASDVWALVRPRASGAAYEVIGGDAGPVTGVGRVTVDTVACLR